MTKANVNQFVKSIKTKVVKHSPAILTGIGITGMITTNDLMMNLFKQ